MEQITGSGANLNSAIIGRISNADKPNTYKGTLKLYIQSRAVASKRVSNLTNVVGIMKEWGALFETADKVWKVELRQDSGDTITVASNNEITLQ